MEATGKTPGRVAGEDPYEALSWQFKESVEEVTKRLGTNAAQGLDSDTAAYRLEKHGPNSLTPPRQTPWWLLLFAQFTDLFSLLLLFAAAICVLAFALDPQEDMHLYLAGFLFSVVLATSLFSFYQERESKKTLREFSKMLPPKATVVRDGGRLQIIDASELVVGDIVIINLGDRIPADVRVAENNHLSVDNSALTGESEPCERAVDQTSDHVLETANVAFFGTLAVEGSAKAIVVATGDSTMFGSIAALTGSAGARAGSTTLQKDIHHFVVTVTCFAVMIGVFFFVVGLLKGTKIIRNLVYSIGIIVSNVPEGLIATVTVSLTASARRMARRNVLVKRLEAIETLGSSTAICTDKTGTLTQNRMSVAHLAYAGKVEVVHPEWAPPVPETAITSPEDRATHRGLQALLFGATHCSTAVFDCGPGTSANEPALERPINGDASEAGILRFMERFGSVELERQRHPRVAIVPFNSSNKYMVTVHSDPNTSALTLIMKGAPERVVERCRATGIGESTRELTETDKELIEKQVDYLAGKGERVLAFAQMELSPALENRIRQDSAEVPLEGLTFVGLISLVDPPRETVPRAVESCRLAGIRVIMVTGDHQATARSIAEQVGIVTGPVEGDDEAIPDSYENALVVHGADIPSFSEETWNSVLSHHEVVFARTSPQQKLEIVRELQRLHHIVAVTGDGVNDAPALKTANTGIAMGISGSEVSREAADIVLLDDNFASIVSGVEEGRLIFDNLKKSISYTLTSNVPQLIPFILYLLLQIPLPLTTVLILCIDLGTDIFPAISLAYEKPEWDVMRRPPRNRKRNRLLNARLLSFSMLQLGIIQSFGGFFSYFVVMNQYGFSPRTLLHLDAEGRFGTERLSDQRWLYLERTKPRGTGIAAQWFANDTETLRPFFTSTVPGFRPQRKERFNQVVAGQTTEVQGLGKVPSAPEFNNMVKIIASRTGRPPCLQYGCLLGAANKTTLNDAACYDPSVNPGDLYLVGILKGDLNGRVDPGRGLRQGCFDLLAPRQERGIVETSQTAFFASVVVSQVFTLLTTKTRVLSIFQHGIQNRAILGSLLMEIAIAICLVYLPVFKHALNVRPLRLAAWVPAVPFGMLILSFDELRKLCIRRHLRRLVAIQEGTASRPGVLDSIAKYAYGTLW